MVFRTSIIVLALVFALPRTLEASQEERPQENSQAKVINFIKNNPGKTYWATLALLDLAAIAYKPSNIKNNLSLFGLGLLPREEVVDNITSVPCIMGSITFFSIGITVIFYAEQWRAKMREKRRQDQIETYTKNLNKELYQAHLNRN